eukprot:Amastigsp_a676326_92.p3 type:complete len:192 gc:universal Amastigsp_a676326_92:1-576(+)
MGSSLLRSCSLQLIRLTLSSRSNDGKRWNGRPSSHDAAARGNDHDAQLAAGACLRHYFARSEANWCQARKGCCSVLLEPCAAPRLGPLGAAASLPDAGKHALVQRAQGAVCSCFRDCLRGHFRGGDCRDAQCAAPWRHPLSHAVCVRAWLLRVPHDRGFACVRHLQVHLRAAYCRRGLFHLGYGRLGRLLD